MKILVFGSLNIDHDYHLEHIVAPKETLTVDSYEVVAGGKGLNASIALAKTKQQVYLAGVLGKNSELLVDSLNKYKVDTTFLDKQDVAAGHAIIQIDQNGENSIFVYPGSNACVRKGHVDEVLKHFSKGDFIIMQNEINNQDYIMTKAHEKGMIIFLNPSPCNKKLDTQPLEYVDYFFINEVEGFQLTNKTDSSEILQKMLDKFPNSHVILTLGSNGAYYSDNQQTLHCPAKKVSAIDTVGAGDTFMGYFIYGLTQNFNPQQCLEIATKASSITVQRKGAASSIPTIEEVNEI